MTFALMSLQRRWGGEKIPCASILAPFYVGCKLEQPRLHGIKRNRSHNPIMALPIFMWTY